MSVALQEDMAGLPEVRSWCLPPPLRSALPATARSQAASALRHALARRALTRCLRRPPLSPARCYPLLLPCGRENKIKKRAELLPCSAPRHCHRRPRRCGVAGRRKSSPATPHVPIGLLPTRRPIYERKVRERRGRERRGKKEVLTVQPDMWGLRGSHADSAATSNEIRVKTT